MDYATWVMAVWSGVFGLQAETYVFPDEFSCSMAANAVSRYLHEGGTVACFKPSIIYVSDPKKKE